MNFIWDTLTLSCKKFSFPNFFRSQLNTTRPSLCRLGFGNENAPQKNVVCSLHVYWVGKASSTCSLVQFPVWVYSYKDNPGASNLVTCTCDTSTALDFEVADSLREEGGMLAALATLPCCCFGAMGFPLANFSGWDG